MYMSEAMHLWLCPLQRSHQHVTACVAGYAFVVMSTRRSVGHDNVDSLWYWLLCDRCFPWGGLFRGIEAVLVEVVHEGVVSKFGRVR